jgi:AraC family transcriptional regulator of adaptative response/methylated-DNA-[protein]-cysteine methyltransferase
VRVISPGEHAAIVEGKAALPITLPMPSVAEGSRYRPTMLRAEKLETPIGPMLAVADETGLRLLEFAGRPALPAELARLERSFGPVGFGATAVVDALREQLAAYFAGERCDFEIPIAQPGTAFQAGVWAALQDIPAGETRSYGEFARSLGRPEAVRAVAGANGANTVAILVPCHRLVGADGSLVGYGGGLQRKRWLIEQERRFSSFSQGKKVAAERPDEGVRRSS